MAELDHPADVAQRFEALKRFARWALRQSFEGADICGGDIQEQALKLGLLFECVAKESEPGLLGDIEPGDTIYRFSPWLKA